MRVACGRRDLRWSSQSVSIPRRGTHARSPAAEAAGASARALAPPVAVVSVRADEAEGASDAVARAVSAGASVIVLEEGSGGAIELWSSARTARYALRSAASACLLLVADRADVACSAFADGVLLEPNGAPADAAASVFSSHGMPCSLAARVSDADAAAHAERSGASLLLVPPQKAASVRAALSSSDTLVVAEAASYARQQTSLLCHVDGAEISPSVWRRRGGPERAIPILKEEVSAAENSASCPADSGSTEVSNDNVQTSHYLGNLRHELASVLEDVQRLAQSVASSSTVSATEADKVSAAREQLQQPFTVVVAGEFSSGKSSVLNGLLGDSFLLEGVMPTTEGVTALKFADEPTEFVRPDGVIERKIPSQLLRRVQLVDTPGTNAVLREQQALAEEYVPRADLVLAVLSADRPLTASEEDFLSYLSKYEKRVAVAINKVDILRSKSDVDEICAFVERHCERALGYKPAEIIPVSAKAGPRAGGMEELEAALFQRLLSSESERLKILNPLGVASSAISDSQSELERQADELANEAEQAHLMPQRADNLGAEVQRRSQATRKQIRDTIDTACANTESIVNEHFTVGNAWRLTRELIVEQHFHENSSESHPSASSICREYMAKIAGESASSVLAALEWHSQWLRQESLTVLEGAADAIRERGFPCDPAERAERLNALPNTALSHFKGFSHEAAAQLLANEAREMVSAIAMSAGISISFGLLGAAIAQSLPEDVSVLSIAASAAFASSQGIVTSKRGGAKRKVRRVSESLKESADELLQSDESSAVKECAESLRVLSEPWLLETHRLSSAAQASVKQAHKLSQHISSLRERLDGTAPAMNEQQQAASC